jgi:hypothetical protein
MRHVRGKLFSGLMHRLARYRIKRIMVRRLPLVCCLAWTSAAFSQSAYKVVTVTNGGTISGIVQWSGPAALNAPPRGRHKSQPRRVVPRLGNSDARILTPSPPGLAIRRAKALALSGTGACEFVSSAELPPSLHLPCAQFRLIHNRLRHAPGHSASGGALPGADRLALGTFSLPMLSYTSFWEGLLTANSK